MRGLVVVLCLCLGSIARAEPAEPVQSYRSQVIASDAVAATGFLILRNMDDPDRTLAKLDIVLYMIGAPFVHAQHQRGYRTVASLAVRAALPVVVGGIGYVLDDGCPHCDQGTDGWAYGLILGGLGAMVLDATVISRPVPLEAHGVVPSASATRGGATFGVAGWF